MSIVAFKARSFDSYAQEYFLLSTEVEINSFWKRMDVIMERMDKYEKKVFFEQLLSSIDKDMQEIRSLKAKMS